MMDYINIKESTVTPTHKLERDRISFLIIRDGIGGAVSFVKQTFKGYRSVMKNRNSAGYRCGYGLAYRRELVSSCVVFRRFLRDNAV